MASDKIRSNVTFSSERCASGELIRFFVDAYQYVTKNGYDREIDWARSLGLDKCTEEQFFQEYVWVVLNSGMKEQVARKIYTDFMKGQDVNLIGHPMKRKAVFKIMNDYSIKEILTDLRATEAIEEQLAILDDLPMIGPITKYHLAKNIGLDIAKPDRHLVRLAERFHYPNPQVLCEALALEFSERVAVIDQILWRYCNLNSGVC